MKFFLRIAFIFLGLFLGVQQLSAIVIIETVSVGDTNNTADSATGYGAVQSFTKLERRKLLRRNIVLFSMPSHKIQTHMVFTIQTWRQTGVVQQFVCKLVSSGLFDFSTSVSC